MGATDFEVRAKANTMYDAYKNCVDRALEEDGNDAYNGTISTTSGIEDRTKHFKASGLSLKDYINEYEGTKWGPALGVCIQEPVGNTNKIKSLVEHKVTKGAKKWVLMYEVSLFDGGVIASERTKGEAVKAARAHTEKTRIRTFINMVKVLEKGDRCVAEITYKHNGKESYGEYVLWGIAAC